MVIHLKKQRAYECFCYMDKGISFTTKILVKSLYISLGTRTAYLLIC